MTTSPPDWPPPPTLVPVPAPALVLLTAFTEVETEVDDDGGEDPPAELANPGGLSDSGVAERFMSGPPSGHD